MSGREPITGNDAGERIREIICAAAPALRTLPDDASLFDSGLVDSLAFLNILRNLEQTFATPMGGNDVDFAELSTIEAITAHVARHRLDGRRATVSPGEPDGPDGRLPGHD